MKYIIKSDKVKVENNNITLKNEKELTKFYVDELNYLINTNKSDEEYVRVLKVEIELIKQSRLSIPYIEDEIERLGYKIEKEASWI